MREKRRNGRIATTTVEDEIAHLRGLDLNGLRARWQSVFQKSSPAHLPRHLLFALIAYEVFYAVSWQFATSHLPSGSHAERIGVWQALDFSSLQRRHGAGFVEPDVLIELLRQVGLEVMARELSFGPVDDADRPL